MQRSIEHSVLRAEIVAICRHLLATGYVVGTFGNVSARIPGGLLISPTRIGFDVLAPADLVEVADDGAPRPENHLPSSELDVHRQIYLRRPDVQAVIHSHSLYATALSCLHQTIPVIVEEQSQVIGAEICTTPYIPAGNHAALGEVAADALGRGNAVLLANHGPVCCGRSLAEALFAVSITERVAHMHFLTAAAHGAIPIPPAFVASERDRFLHRYGTDADRTKKVCPTAGT